MATKGAVLIILFPIAAGAVWLLFRAGFRLIFGAELPSQRYAETQGLRCHACGYSLRGITSVQCPECGAVRMKHVSAPQKLPASLRGERLAARYRQIHRKPWIYRPVEIQRLTEADRTYFEAATRTLEGHGYRLLGDLVNVTLRMDGGKGGTSRLMVSTDGSVMASFYRLVSKDAQAVLMYQAETEFNDGTFLVTCNAAEVALLTAPPQVRRRLFSRCTPVAELLAAHESEKQRLVAGNLLQSVSISSLDDALASQRRYDQHRLSFRRQIGYVDPDEVARAAQLEGESEEEIEKLRRAVDWARRKFRRAPDI